MRITDDFIRHGENCPHQLAVDFGTSCCTYGELLAAIHQKEFLTQNCIALLMPNSIEFLETFLGTVRAGGIAMVLNPDWPKAQIQNILTRWAPTDLVAEPSLLEGLEVDERVMEVEGGVQNSELSIQNSESGSLTADRKELTDCANNELFYIGFTSGTTGMPKGVVRSHASWVRSFQAGRVEFTWQEKEQVLVPGAFVHSLSLYSAVEALANGATIHGLTKFTPKAALQRCLDYPITRLVAVPTLLGAIARTAARTALTFPTVRKVISGGSKLSPELRSQLHTIFPNAHVLEYYGASELSFITLASSAESVPPQSVGRPFHGVEVSIRQADGTVAPPGEIGWIGIRSEMICSGYLTPDEMTSNDEKDDEKDGKKPEEEISKIRNKTGFRIEHGWATVGDRGWFDSQGYLYLAGREGDMLICNGINVYPSEIEAVLLTHPAIENAVVLGLPDDCRGDRLYAFITLHHTSSPSHDPATHSTPAPLIRQTLHTYLSTYLSPSKCPHQFLLIDKFPVNASGKIDRLVLKNRLLRENSSGIQT